MYHSLLIPSPNWRTFWLLPTFGSIHLGKYLGAQLLDYMIRIYVIIININYNYIWYLIIIIYYIIVIPFSSHLQSFPASGSFQMSQFFVSGGQSIGVSASASVLPMNIKGLLSFRMDWLDLFDVQGTLQSLLQHHSSKASILQSSAFFIVQLSHPYMTTGKNIALTKRTFVGKVMSLLFNKLSRLVITFLPRSKHVLISRLQSAPVVECALNWSLLAFGTFRLRRTSACWSAWRKGPKTWQQGQDTCHCWSIHTKNIRAIKILLDFCPFFLIGLFDFLLMSFISLVLYDSPLSDLSFENIFFQSVACCLILLNLNYFNTTLLDVVWAYKIYLRQNIWVLSCLLGNIYFLDAERSTLLLLLVTSEALGLSRWC